MLTMVRERYHQGRVQELCYVPLKFPLNPIEECPAKEGSVLKMVPFTDIRSKLKGGGLGTRSRVPINPRILCHPPYVSTLDRSLPVLL